MCWINWTPPDDIGNGERGGQDWALEIGEWPALAHPFLQAAVIVISVVAVQASIRGIGLLCIMDFYVLAESAEAGA